jgi:hypothetical protein
MKATHFQLFGATPVLQKPRYSSSVNQFGLKPESNYDYRNPTNLVNYGRGTTMDTLNVRRSPTGQPGSSPSLDGMSILDQVPRMLGLVRNDNNALSFCSSETAALRLCMAKGQSACDRENTNLDACLARVMPLRKAISTAGRGFNDWFITTVSDNYTKPYTHRPQDNGDERAQEHLWNSKRMGGRAYGKYPKRLAWSAKSNKEPGFARRSRLTVNK